MRHARKSTRISVTMSLTAYHIHRQLGERVKCHSPEKGRPQRKPLFLFRAHSGMKDNLERNKNVDRYHAIGYWSLQLYFVAVQAYASHLHR